MVTSYNELSDTSVWYFIIMSQYRQVTTVRSSDQLLL